MSLAKISALDLMLRMLGVLLLNELVNMINIKKWWYPRGTENQETS
ncbi:hypothetical protein BBG19_0934 [Francisella sp. MA067296]|nr:hypothetical protein BBG19_0934 [Francisella sp. MA067296]